MSSDTERFRLEIPADPAYVGTARMFASTLARHFEISDETVEDLKIAVSEGCKRALAAEASDGVAIEVQRDDGRLVFEIEQGDVAPPPSESSDEIAEGLSLELVGALFEDAEVASSPGGRVLRFSVR